MISRSMLNSRKICYNNSNIKAVIVLSEQIIITIVIMIIALTILIINVIMIFIILGLIVNLFIWWIWRNGGGQSVTTKFKMMIWQLDEVNYMKLSEDKISQKHKTSFFINIMSYSEKLLSPKFLVMKN